jgi:hypothetical protein
MTLLLALTIACCIFSALNLLFVILLSNSVFRLFYTKERTIEGDKKESDRGLVDVRDTPTYDPRFR